RRDPALALMLAGSDRRGVDRVELPEALSLGRRELLQLHGFALRAASDSVTLLPDRAPEYRVHLPGRHPPVGPARMIDWQLARDSRQPEAGQPGDDSRAAPRTQGGQPRGARQGDRD